MAFSLVAYVSLIQKLDKTNFYDGFISHFLELNNFVFQNVDAKNSQSGKLFSSQPLSDAKISSRRHMKKCTNEEVGVYPSNLLMKFPCEIGSILLCADGNWFFFTQEYKKFSALHSNQIIRNNFQFQSDTVHILTSIKVLSKNDILFPIAYNGKRYVGISM